MAEIGTELSHKRRVEIDETKVNVIDISSDEDEEMQDVENATHVSGLQDELITTPLKTADSNRTESANKKTAKQIQKEQEKLEKERKREQEKLERERKKEEERKLKEEKRLKKELEKERLKKEKETKLEQQKKEREAKLEQQRKEKEEREAQRLKEKEEKEQQRLKEKLEKEKEREQKELEKKKTEEAQKKKQEKLKISNFFKPKTIVKSVTVTAAQVDKANISFYERTFNEFYLRENAEMHTFNRLTGEQLQASISEFDTGLKSGSSDLKEWFQSEPPSTMEPPLQRDAKYIYENSLENAPLRIKFIKFYENVKSWNGSYTKPFPKTLAINPFQEMEECFIDWDDEGDENEEGEGEDISENDEEDEDEDEDDDIGDFLEQDQQSPNSQTRISGPLIPKISWKGENETQYKVEILKANISFPINPLGNFWDTPPVSQTPSKHENEAQESPNAKKPKSLITDKCDLEKFAKEVNESDYTIPTMVEILKKQFPNYTKSTIENTLRNLAKRVGPKSTERKWQVNTELLNKLIE